MPQSSAISAAERNPIELHPYRQNWWDYYSRGGYLLPISAINIRTCLSFESYSWLLKTVKVIIYFLLYPCLRASYALIISCSSSVIPTQLLHASFWCSQRGGWSGTSSTLLSQKPCSQHAVSTDYMLCSHLGRVFSPDRRVIFLTCGNAVRLRATDYMD